MKCAQVAELDFFGAFPQTLWSSPWGQVTPACLLFAVSVVSPQKRQREDTWTMH